MRRFDPSADTPTPDYVRRNADGSLDLSHEPTKAYLRAVVADAASGKLKVGQGTRRRYPSRKPLYQSNPARGRMLRLARLCREIAEIASEEGVGSILDAADSAAERERFAGQIAAGLPAMETIARKVNPATAATARGSECSQDTPSLRPGGDHYVDRSR